MLKKVVMKKPIKLVAYQIEKELSISTLEGIMHANAGDWIITGVKGEQYPVKKEIFEQTYNVIENAVD